MKKSFLVSLLIIFFVGLYLFGCSGGEKDGEQSKKEGAATHPEDVEVDSDGDSFKMEYKDDESGEEVKWDVKDGKGRITATDKDGKKTAEMTFGGSELPDGFPEDFPLYDGKIANSVKSSIKDGTGYSITLTTEDDVDEIYSWYKEELSAKDYKINSSVTLPGMKSLLFRSGDRQGTVMVQKGNENVNIVISMTISE